MNALPARTYESKFKTEAARLWDEDLASLRDTQSKTNNLIKWKFVLFKINLQTGNPKACLKLAREINEGLKQSAEALEMEIETWKDMKLTAENLQNRGLASSSGLAPQCQRAICKALEPFDSRYERLFDLRINDLYNLNQYRSKIDSWLSSNPKPKIEALKKLAISLQSGPCLQ